jgi:hypothetical protein
MRVKGWNPSYAQAYKSYYFSGVGDYVTGTDTFNAASSYEILFHILSSDATAVTSTWFDARDGAGDGVRISTVNNTGVLTVDHNAVSLSTVTSDLHDGAHHYVQVLWDGANLTISIDGGAEVVQTAVATAVSTTTNYRIGARNFTSPQDYAIGSLWDFKLVVGGATYTWFKMNESLGSTAYDYSTGANDAVITAVDLSVFHTETTFTQAGEQAFYLSTVPYASKANDVDPDKYFDPVLDDDLTITYGVPFFEDGRIESGFGDISITNVDHVLDQWMGYDFGGRELIILWGDPAWSLEDFLVKPLLIGKVASFQFEGDKIVIKAGDKSEILNRPVSEALVVDATPNVTNTIGQNLPLTYGRPFQIEPICIDSTDKIYQWSQGTSDNSVAPVVYDSGVSGVGHTVDYANSKITLTGGAPAGKITIEANGVDGTTYLTTVADIVENLVTAQGDSTRRLSAADIDTASFAQINTDVPYEIATYIQEKQNLLDELDWLLLPLGCFWYFDHGVMFLGRIEDPSSGTPVGEINSSMTTEINVSPLNTRRWRTRLGYKRNWSVQEEGSLGAAVSLSDKQNLSTEYQLATYTDSSVKTTALNAIDAEPLNTALMIKADAEMEAQRQQTILGSQCYSVELSVVGAPLSILPGQVWTIYDDFYGLSAGKKIQILEIEKNLLDGTMTIKGWYKI